MTLFPTIKQHICACFSSSKSHQVEEKKHPPEVIHLQLTIFTWDGITGEKIWTNPEDESGRQTDKHNTIYLHKEQR